MHPDDLVKLLKKIAPRKLRLTNTDGETKVLIVPQIRNRWNAVLRMLDGEPWVKLELLDKGGDIMGPPIERDLGGMGGAVDVDVSQSASAGAQGAGFQLAALAGIVQLVVKAQQVVLDEHRRSFQTIMDASIHTLSVVTSRLEGMEKSADKMLRLAFDTTRAQAALSTIDGDGGGKSGEALVGFVQAYMAGQEERRAAREQQQQQQQQQGKSPPGANPAGSNGANGHRG